jgi:hypothetical protein
VLLPAVYRTDTGWGDKGARGFLPPPKATNRPAGATMRIELVDWADGYACASLVGRPSCRILRYRFERCRPIRFAASLMLPRARSMFFLMYSI